MANQSDEAVIVYLSGVQREILQPGQSHDFVFAGFEGAKTIEVKRLQDGVAGNTLLKQSFTWEELGKRKIRLVVE